METAKNIILSFIVFIFANGTMVATTSASSLVKSRLDTSIANSNLQFATITHYAKAPIGWRQFCNNLPEECRYGTPQPKDIVLNTETFNVLHQINLEVNHTVAPITDIDHHGVIERWQYPNNYRGDCEDYVLLKRKMLVAAGFPKEALLITVVKDQRGDGHAVLTVKTNKGELILDNQDDDIHLWSDTPYEYIKRQSQEHVNKWVYLNDTRYTAGITTTR